MWWNLNMFGKFAFEIRLDYLYLWKSHFLNLRDFQKSPNPYWTPIGPLFFTPYWTTSILGQGKIRMITFEFVRPRQADYISTVKVDV